MSSGILRPSSYAAAPVLDEPLLPNKQSRHTNSLSSDDDSEIEEAASVHSARSAGRILPKSMSRKDIISTVGVGLLATAGLAASLSAMVAFPSAAVILMGGICMVNSPILGQKHLRIAKSEGVRTSVNMIREEITFLKNEVNFLEQAVDDLQADAESLKSVEQSLQNIAAEQGTSVNHLVQLVNENESILNAMKANMKETFVASMAGIVLRSDADGNGKIDLHELPLLSIRLGLQLQPYGIKLDTSKFEAMIKEDNDISNVLKFCAEVLFDGDSEDKTDNDDNSVDSEVTFDFESFARSLDADGPPRMTVAEKMSMITVSEKYSRGSVEVARGKRMTLHQSKGKSGVERGTIMKEVKRRQTKVTAHRPLMPIEESRETRITLGGLVIIRGTSAEV
mmetsp:Transcript_2574/g.5465  ORF Transcript_2574/g.5465 Transcript_2574/m.5465 type:complete len:395 (+) Transcript_2574:155-1339(+)